PSPDVVFPSSHCSRSGWTDPSPHTGSLHAVVQSSAELELPSSHCSLPSFTPFPQTGRLQAVVQASALESLPSSHSSPTFSMPSPQVAGAHSPSMQSPSHASETTLARSSAHAYRTWSTQ